MTFDIPALVNSIVQFSTQSLTLSFPTQTIPIQKQRHDLYTPEIALSLDGQDEPQNDDAQNESVVIEDSIRHSSSWGSASKYELDMDPQSH